MIVFVTDTGGPQLIHCFIGDESRTPMMMSSGAILPIGDIIRHLDAQRPVLLITQLVESEEECRKQAMDNMAQTGTFVSHPITEIFMPGAPPMQFAGRSYSNVAATTAAPSDARCAGCGAPAPADKLNADRLCASCASLNAKIPTPGGHVLARPPVPPGETVAYATRMARLLLPALNHASAGGFSVKLVSDPALPTHAITVAANPAVYAETKPFYEE